MRQRAAAVDRVWYVAFGSNLSARRLRRYLDRVPPAAGPEDAVPVVLPHRLFFARASRRWGGGGTAFVHRDHDPGARTLGTAWLLRTDQFLGVLAGENGLGAVDVDVGGLPTQPGAWDEVVPGHHYGLVLVCASPDDRPAFTVTTPAPEPPNPPAEDYVATIVDGLVAGHGLTEDQARAYVDARIA